MSPEQFDRWKDFAQRMAVHAHPDLSEGDRTESSQLVNDIFESMEQDAADIRGWDGEGGKIYVCDRIREWAEDTGHLEYDEESGERDYSDVGLAVTCSVRAGLDVACKPSGGVLGYDLNDLRRMYPDGLPDWVSEFLPDTYRQASGNTPLWL